MLILDAVQRQAQEFKTSLVSTGVSKVKRLLLDEHSWGLGHLLTHSFPWKKIKITN